MTINSFRQSRFVVASLTILVLATRVIAADLKGAVPQTVGPPHVIGPSFWGLNIENVYMSPVLAWTNPSLEMALEHAEIESVRFPGGDAGNYWDWRKGAMYPRGGPANVEDSLQELSRLSETAGVTPLYNLNVMTYENDLITPATLSTAMDNQIELLRVAEGRGPSVKYIELGNEFYWSTPDHNQEFPTAKDYQLSANEWAAALKQQFPDAKFASMLSIPNASDARTRSWNGAVLENIHGIEAVTIHRYDNIVDGGFGNSLPMAYL